MMTTGLYAGLLGLLLVILSFRISLVRRARQISLGTGGDAELERRVRAHGNFCEFVPMALLLLALLEADGLPLWGLHALGTALVVARVLHAIGMGNTKGFGLRAFGSALTYTVVLVASAALLGLLLPR